MTRVFLLDGSALAFRAHFAMSRSGLTSAEGQPTGAVYGFTATLRRILEQEDPDLIAVAFDAEGPTFRHERFDDYKATRQRAPDELLAQLDRIREVVRAHGIPVFEVPGYEADDVIGTLARQACDAGCEVFVVTGDKDFMQIVDERVKLYNVFKPNEELVVQGPAEVREKFGVGPEHVVDVLAIMGDSSDNVPGVKGIGEKGAIQLVSKHGSVQGILEHLDELPPKTREKIERSRDMLALSLDLVRIDRDVPLDPGFESLCKAEPDRKRLVELFRALDFQSLVEKVASGVRQEVPCDYRTVRDEEDLDRMIAELREKGRFAIDTETDGLAPCEARLVGISASAAERAAWYVPCNLEPPVLPGGTEAIVEKLAPLLLDPSCELVGQNTKFDWIVLGRHGLHLPPPAFDTMVASYCVAGAGRRHGMDALALHYFGLRKIPTKELLGTGKAQITMAEVPVDTVAEYACEDADVTWRLYGVLSRELEELGMQALFHDLEMPLVPVLAAMEERGIRLDVEHVRGLGESMEEECRRLTWEIQEIADENVNPNSTKALGQVLFEKLRIQDQAGVKRPRRTKTGWSTDADTLAQQYGSVPIVQKLLEYREVQKLKSTYVDQLPRFVNPETGRIHCSFSQTTAATGRLASSDPNLQNIPIRTERGQRLREAFVPREPDEHGEWALVSADYSQIELRVMAHLSGDEGLRAAFEEGRDIHAATASRVFGVAPEEVTRRQRSQAKVINFGLLYGMGPARVARETGLSLQEAKEFIERYFGAFPAVRTWIDTLLAEARERGYVETILGRRRRMPELRSEDPRVRAFAENAAINTPVQGSAADVIKRAMIDVERELGASGLAGRMLLQVHDELVFEAPLSQLEETTALVRSAMQDAVVLDVPLQVEIGSGRNWLLAH